MQDNRSGIICIGPDGCPEFAEHGLLIILDNVKGKTLGEVDIEHVFENDRAHKGLAGAVIERSVLGYPANSEQRHDILIDGIPTEVKTTGLKKKNGELVAKEPISITAVGLEYIGREVFFKSHFWDKVSQILFVFYLYDSADRVEYGEYAKFPILGHLIYHPDNRATELMKADWECVQSFIMMLQRDYEHPEEQYPRLSHELRSVLVVLDTAPKYPHNPRFRLKRSYVDFLVHSYFSDTKQEHLSLDLDRYADLDLECARLTEIYGRRTVGEISAGFGIYKMTKMASEQILVRMFGGKSKKLSKIEQFNECSVICKSVVISCTGGRTEDCKLYTVDFEEMLDPDIDEFTNSVIYDYFANHQFLIALFQEPYAGCDFSENRFLGFKRISLPDEVLGYAFACWSDFRKTYFSGQLKETPVLKDGEPIINKCGTVRTSVNFPKSKDHIIFMRGTATDSTYKTERIGDIKICPTQIWIKGKYLVDLIKREVDFNSFKS